MAAKAAPATSPSLTPADRGRGRSLHRRLCGQRRARMCSISAADLRRFRPTSKSVESTKLGLRQRAGQPVAKRRRRAPHRIVNPNSPAAAPRSASNCAAYAGRSVSGGYPCRSSNHTPSIAPPNSGGSIASAGSASWGHDQAGAAIHREGLIAGEIEDARRVHHHQRVQPLRVHRRPRPRQPFLVLGLRKRKFRLQVRQAGLREPSHRTGWDAPA